jgi:hypothetical protein
VEGVARRVDLGGDAVAVGEGEVHPDTAAPAAASDADEPHGDVAGAEQVGEVSGGVGGHDGEDVVTGVVDRRWRH